jgi:hypothetical protein
MKFNRVSILGLAIAATLSVASPAIAQKGPAEPINVFVFAATGGGGFKDPLTDSARDIERMLYDKNKIIVVSRPEQADIKIEVLERRGESLQATLVFVRMTAGTYSLDMSGQDDGNLPSWGGAAEDVASKIRKWIKRNHDRLIAQRVQK